MTSRWLDLLSRSWAIPLAVLLLGILLHSMNVLMTATILPSIVADIGGAEQMSWATTAFLSSSIVAATCTSLAVGLLGARRAYCTGAAIFCAGALLCASAGSMLQLTGGRLVQGFGGGLLAGLAYVLVRNVFPSSLWARVFALLSGIWGISVLVGPLVGGIFADLALWRGAFGIVSALAGFVALVAWWGLPSDAAGPADTRPRVPVLRVALVCFAIAAMSLAAVIQQIAIKAALIVLALAALVAMLRIDRKSAQPLLPSDAFSLATPTGAGLWLILLLSVSYSPMPIFAPLFMQQLHGLDPLSAGYMVAVQSMGWTGAAMLVAGASPVWISRFIAAGAPLMIAGLLGLAWFLGPGPVTAVILPALALGIGIGSSWAFIVQRIMQGAKPGEEDLAASSVPTVQQTGFALGAALAGLVGNATGIATDLQAADLRSAAFWVPLSFVASAVVASLIALRLNLLVRQ